MWRSKISLAPVIRDLHVTAERIGFLLSTQLRDSPTITIAKRKIYDCLTLTLPLPPSHLTLSTHSPTPVLYPPGSPLHQDSVQYPVQKPIHVVCRLGWCWVMSIEKTPRGKHLPLSLGWRLCAVVALNCSQVVAGTSQTANLCLCERF